ncbi:MFS transporter [Arthrobacter sp. PAMC25564]|uniref:MFS transporter n=1 Tax=Arthrobacter sp. PAMC25564 TaxID=2565366 RepID=UPI0010A2A57F|nr:MFS transporter [Arthrobacter sp. PAMC25564]QCB95927.1 MFS transporter [Arthrobacter sp. PAMC25564]
MQLQERIDASRMSLYQWLIVGLCIVLNALDGFDVLAMAFTANSVTREFGLSGAELGILLSAGLVGMAIGSLGLAPFADLIGRRPMVLVSVGLATTGMLLASLSHSAVELGIWRVVTGLGIGGILACTNVIASEYSSKRWRGLAISIYTAGYGIGATLGGTAAVTLQASFGWRSVFLFGGICTAATFVLLAVLLPESVDFLATRRPRNVLDRLNKIARKIGQPAVTELPAAAVKADRENKLSELFTAGNRRSTWLVWLAFFATMFGFYFVNSWTPRLLVTAGMTESQGVVGGLMLTLGGTFGSLLYGLLTIRWNSRKVMIAFAVLSAATMVMFISTAGVLALAFVAGGVVGMLINGCIAGMYTITPALYGASVRSTGVGWAIGIGRVGAIVAPLMTGALLDAHWTASMLYMGVGVVVLVAGAAVAAMRPAAPEARSSAEVQEKLTTAV